MLSPTLLHKFLYGYRPVYRFYPVPIKDSRNQGHYRLLTLQDQAPSMIFPVIAVKQLYLVLTVMLPKHLVEFVGIYEHNYIYVTAEV